MARHTDQTRFEHTIWPRALHWPLLYWVYTATRIEFTSYSVCHQMPLYSPYLSESPIRSGVAMRSLGLTTSLNAAPRKTPRFPHMFWLAVLHLHGCALTEHPCIRSCVLQPRAFSSLI